MSRDAAGNDTSEATDCGVLLAAGTPAPGFKLECSPQRQLSLESFRGRPVVLVFYPADWSPVCTNQLAIYNHVLSMFERYDAAVLGISVDSVWCHQAFSEAGRIEFPLLADFEPKGEVARRYGAYDAKVGCAKRALFVIDRSGTIAWNCASPFDVNPGADGIFDALDALEARR